MRPSLFLIALLTALAAASSARAVERLVDIGNDRWVEVSGEGVVSAAPDFAQVTVGVTSVGRNAGEAMAANAKAANALVSVIKAEGVAPADIQTSNLSISPTFSQSSPGQTSASSQRVARSSRTSIGARSTPARQTMSGSWCGIGVRDSRRSQRKISGLSSGPTTPAP